MRPARKIGIATVLGNLLVIASPAPASADVPGGGIVRDALDGASGWAFEGIAEGIATWVLGGVAFFVEGALGFLETSARPQVEADWFAGPGSPFAAVRNIAGVLLLAFALLGILQGLLHGDVGMMLRQVIGKLPLAVLGMVVTVAAVGKMLDLTDALSAAVLATTGEQALHFLSGFGAAVTGATSGFAAVVLGLVAVIAALILWVELLVRASLVYLLVAISPLGFAAMLWPSARGFLRKTIELLLAVILSKFVIAVALSIGVAALAGAGDPAQGAGGAGGAQATSATGAGLAMLLVGSVVVGLAAFAPFIVLKLVPIAEAALAAQGVSRSPVRAMQSGASTYNSVSRLTGGHSGTRGGQPSAGAGAAPAGSAAQAATHGGAATKAAGSGAGIAAGAATARIAAAATATRRTVATADRASDSTGRLRDQRPTPTAPARIDQGSGK